MRRSLLLLAFVFAVLGVHPCDTAPHDPAADHNAHHSAAAPMVPGADDTSPEDCMAGACEIAPGTEMAAAPVVADTLVALNPSPLGSLAAGMSQGHLHSGQSPGQHAPEPLLSVLRT